MTKLLRVFLLVALCLSLNAFAQRQATAPAPAERLANRVQTINFESKLVGKPLPYNVILPVDYDQPAARTKRYPVLYLLHGLFGHYDNWATKTKLAQYAAPYSMIIVTPEGNNNWYTDSLTVPSDKYESYIVDELIPDVQRRFRALETREGRAIAGLSMGGYGSLKFGVKYPDRFILAGSFSGAFGVASWTKSESGSLEAIYTTLVPVFGPPDSSTRQANDLYKLYRELPSERLSALPFIYFDCGTEDPLFQSNRILADILITKKIPHEYRELPGKHDWTYWDAQVQELLKIAAGKFPQTSQTVNVRPRQTQTTSLR